MPLNIFQVKIKLMTGAWEFSLFTFHFLLFYFTFYSFWSIEIEIEAEAEKSHGNSYKIPRENNSDGKKIPMQDNINEWDAQFSHR